MTRIAGRIADNREFDSSLRTLLGPYQGQGGLSANLSAYSGLLGGGYQQQFAGELQTYPILGNTILGTDAYQTNRRFDIESVINNSVKAADQWRVTGHALASDANDLAAAQATREHDAAVFGATLSAILQASQQTRPQPESKIFRFNQLTQPAAAVPPAAQYSQSTQFSASSTTAPASQGGQSSIAQAAESVLATKCASCHNSEKASGGFDLAKADLAGVREIDRRINLTQDQEGFMPRRPEGDGTSPGDPLSIQEKHVIRSLLLQLEAQSQSQ